MYIWKKSSKNEVKFMGGNRWEYIKICDLFNQGFLETGLVVKTDLILL